MRALRKAIKFPFFGFLFGFLPLLVLWNSNKSQIHNRDVWYSLLLTAGLVTITFAVCLLLFKDKSKASLASTSFFLLFFSYGHLYGLLKVDGLFGLKIGYVKLLVVYALIFIIMLILIICMKTKFSANSILILNGIMALLLLFNLTSIISYNFQVKGSRAGSNQDTAGGPTINNSNNQQLADIYYIVLDAYSRQDILMDLMNYDNSAFINALRERGFFVADCANSNYGATVSSMASSLNYSYLDTDPASANNISLINSLINNQIRADLKTYGYQFVTTRGFSSENDIPNSDIYLDVVNDKSQQEKMAQNQFTRLYFETTLLRSLIELYDQDPVRYSMIPNWLILADRQDGVLGYAMYWYNQTNYVFDSLENFAHIDGNYFVYAHINLPHGPYVFDAQGNFKYVYNPENNIPYYTEAVTYANKRTLQLVDSLIANSSTPPIIILQGDHAAHEITTGFDKNKILNAFYFPEDMKKDLYNTITPVNTFRLILRDYFHRDIDLLPDKVFAKELNTYEYRSSSCNTTQAN